MFRRVNNYFSCHLKLAVSFLMVVIAMQSNAQRIEADYPFLNDLLDSTAQNTATFLEGNPGLPDMPANGIPLCSNGIYIIEPDGQNIQTPYLSDFNINRFQVLIDFNITQLPAINAPRPRMPVVMGGKFARWLGIYLDSSGVIGVKFNNDVNNYIWSSENFNAIEGVWYQAELNYNNGLVSLYVDQALMLTAEVGTLVTFNDDHNFTITDFSEGNPFYGCIRNLTITSFDDLIFKSRFE